jgi:hypothetical protein
MIRIVWPVRFGPERLFLELGLLHHPVRQPPQQFQLRAAALIARDQSQA